MTPLEIARDYLSKGWSPIPVPFKQKGPKAKEWQKLRLTDDTVAGQFNLVEMNIGVLLGPPSGGLTDLDLDCGEAIKLAERGILPPTGYKFGRASKPLSHFLYQTDLNSRTVFSDPNKPEREGMLVEVRANGQTVFPGSIHPSGEMVEWASREHMTEVEGESLIVAAGRLAAASLLLRYWPVKGLRHTAAGAIGGLMGRCGEKMGQDAPAIVELIARLAGDDEVEDRRRAAEDAVADLSTDTKVPGLPKLKEIFGDKVAGKVADWLGYTSHSLLESMNSEYFVIELGGKVVVGTFKTDATGNRNLLHYSFAAFKDLHDNIRVGEGKGIGKGTWWLSNPKRRQYSGIAFASGPKGAVVDTSPLLNLWQGYGVKPVQGDWSLMQQHIRDVLAGGTAPYATYITRWLAWAVQNPTTRAEVMLILKSEEEGTGKGALANQMVQMFGIGVHGVRIDKPKQLTGDFNAHLQRASLLYVDEAYWPGAKADEGAYKGLITEPYFAVQPKGIDIYFVPNCTHIICTSNNDWVAPAGPTARRLAVFKVSPKKVGDRAYFKALFDQMDNGGREAMLHDLLEMDLGDWHPRNDIPQTAELFEQKLQSLDSELKWIIDLLSEGRLPGSANNVNECPSEWLFDDYIRHAGKTGERFKSISTLLGTKLRKWFADCSPAFRHYTGEYPRGDGEGKKRGTIYQFPPLGVCRKAVMKHLNGNMIWQGPDEWEPSMQDERESETRRSAEIEVANPQIADEDIPF